MLSTSMTEVVRSAASYASKVGSGSTDLVHFLLALVDESAVQHSLRNDGINYGEVRERLLVHLESRIPVSVPPIMDLSPLVVTVLERSMLKDSSATAENVLEEIWAVDGYEEYEDFHAVEVLRSLAEEARARTLSRQATQAISEAGNGRRPDTALQAPLVIVSRPSQQEMQLPETVGRFCTDLVNEARRGVIDPVIGRQEQIDRLRDILARRKKNNAILLGEPGVGKTAIVEGLALRIAERSVGPELQSARLLSLDIAGLIGGTRNRGDFEERLKALIDELSSDPNYILFVDEIHVLVGGVQGAADASELMKPALANGRIRCIGATTHGEYGKYFANNGAMARRFQPVNVPEPERAEAVEIMHKLVPTYEAHHRVIYPEGIAEAAVDLSVRYVIDRYLPDKAIDILDEAGAVASGRNMPAVTKDLVHEIVSRMSGVRTSSNPVSAADSFRSRLQKVVKGQDDACARIGKAIARANSGLAPDGRARCSMLFVGPDNHGKRFTAAQIASLQSMPIHRLDMSEYRESHTVSRLIGPPPGYVGFGNGGQLTEPVRRTPTCVLLLDRIDLAHPNAVAIIVQAIETGTVTDTSGHIVSFAGATIILTTVEEKASRSIGFVAKQDDEMEAAGNSCGNIAEAVDSVVRFSPLQGGALREIASARVEDLCHRLKANGISVVTAGDVAAALVGAAGSDAGNAKAVEKVFRKMVEDAVLDACPSDGQLVTVLADASVSDVKVTVSAGA